MSGTGRPGPGRSRRGQPAGRDRRRGVAGRRLPWQSARGRGQRGRGVSGRSLPKRPAGLRSHRGGGVAGRLLPGAMHSSGDELAGKRTFPGGGGRVGGRHHVGFSRRGPSKSGAETKAPPTGDRAAQGVLIASHALLVRRAASGERSHGVQVYFPMADGGREAGARLGVPVFAQPAQLLGPAPGSRQVDFAIARSGDADTVSASVGTTLVAPKGVTR